MDENKEEKKSKNVKEECPVDIGTLKSYFDTCRAEYATEQTRMKVLDLTDRGGLWKALGAKFPSYQILPDTNHTSYIKDNIVASIYTVAKCADLLPTSEDDKSIITNINIALDQEWNLANIGHIQMQAGSNAALHNIGITQVGWDESVIPSGNTMQRGQVKVKNIHPLKFMRDPYATDLQSSGYCLTYERYHKSVFLSNPNYREEFKKFTEGHVSGADVLLDIPQAVDAKQPGAGKDYYTLVIFWVKTEDKDGNVQIDEIHTLNVEHILYVKKAIKPNKFPFAVLYCNDPGDSLIGISAPARAFANSVAYNIMDSISLTAIYKNQRPPKFVSSSSGLNLNSFAKHANDADYTFVVNGDASKAVHYQQFPNIDPNVTNLKLGLQTGLQMVSGVDERYTGRSTGSIITTGGTQEMLERVTVIDTPKISNFEDYTKQLTELVLSNLIQFGGKRKYFYPIPNRVNEYKTVEVDFPKLDPDTAFSYQINISSELPKNRARIAEMANQLMEKQMQYQQAGQEVDLITPEEWLMLQDLPTKEFMLDRMGVQRLNSALEDVSQTLFQYAGLTKNGMDPNEALMAVARTMKDKRQGKIMQEPAIDPLVQAGGGTLPSDTPVPEFG